MIRSRLWGEAEYDQQEMSSGVSVDLSGYYADDDHPMRPLWRSGVGGVKRDPSGIMMRGR